MKSRSKTTHRKAYTYRSFRQISSQINLKLSKKIKTNPAHSKFNKELSKKVQHAGLKRKKRGKLPKSFELKVPSATKSQFERKNSE